jgi:heat shock protein HslJ
MVSILGTVSIRVVVASSMTLLAVGFASRVEGAPTSPNQRLRNTQWTLESLPNGVRPPSPVSLSFRMERLQANERPTLVLTTGLCNSVRGTVEAKAKTMRFRNSSTTAAGCSAGRSVIAAELTSAMLLNQSIRYRISNDHLSFDTPSGELRYVRSSKWQKPSASGAPVVEEAGPFAIEAVQGTWALESVVVDIEGRFVFPDAEWQLKISEKSFELIHPCGSVTGTIQIEGGPLFLKQRILTCFGSSPTASFNLLQGATSGLSATGKLLLRDRDTEFRWARILPG